MQVKLLKDIVSSLAGSSAAKVVDLLYEKKNVNEFLIAKKLNLTINQTRNILYKLADEGLVSFVRKKDSKKGGWYTYFWTLNSGKSLVKFKEKLVNDLASLKNQINIRKTKRFFYCKNDNIEFNEESALLSNYACPECGEVLEAKSTSDEVINLEKDVAKLETFMQEINGEIDIINVQEGKVRARKIKAEAKKKENERKAKKVERDKLKKAEAKKSGKVIPKKKKK